MALADVLNNIRQGVGTVANTMLDYNPQTSDIRLKQRELQQQKEAEQGRTRTYGMHYATQMLDNFYNRMGQVPEDQQPAAWDMAFSTVEHITGIQLPESTKQQYKSFTVKPSKSETGWKPQSPEEEATAAGLKESAIMRARQPFQTGLSAWTPERIAGAIGGLFGRKTDTTSPADNLVDVINPSGKHVKIKRSQLSDALQQGYTQ